MNSTDELIETNLDQISEDIVTSSQKDIKKIITSSSEENESEEISISVDCENKV